MLNLLKKIFKRANKKQGAVLSSSSSLGSVHITSTEILELSGNSKDKTQELNSKITYILEQSINNPSEIFEYIKKYKTDIFIFKSAKYFLNLLKFQEGFITPQVGFVALAINLFLYRKIGFKTKPIFIFENSNINSVTLYYNFYKWFFYKEGILEFCDTSDIVNLSDNDIKNLSYNDVISMKTAVNNDISAINFTLDFIKNHQGSKDIIDKINEEGSANI